MEKVKAKKSWIKEKVIAKFARFNEMNSPMSLFKKLITVNWLNNFIFSLISTDLGWYVVELLLLFHYCKTEPALLILWLWFVDRLLLEETASS